MPVFRIAILLFLLGGLLIFLAQNWSPILPLIIFGNQTPALPIAVWILLFAVAGVFTSLLLQLLNRLARGATPRQVERSVPPPPPRPPRERETINPPRVSEPYRQPPETATPVEEREEWVVEEEER
ncbi:MAG: LapA family protein, partial [Cyanobacteriota bacterium]